MFLGTLFLFVFDPTQHSKMHLFVSPAGGPSTETIQHTSYSQRAPEGPALQEQTETATSSRENPQGSQENPCHQRTAREEGERNLSPAPIGSVGKKVHDGC